MVKKEVFKWIKTGKKTIELRKGKAKSGDQAVFQCGRNILRGKIVREKHLRPATLGDVVDVLRPSSVSTRRILQIAGAWVGLGNLIMLSSNLGQARKHEYYDNIIFGALFSMGFAALHAKINGVSSGGVLNELYLNALRSTVSDFKIGKNRAIGIPLRDEAVEEMSMAPAMKVDGKGRMTIPQHVRAALGWTPGDSLQPRIDFEKGELALSLVKAKQPLCVKLRYADFISSSSFFSGKIWEM